MVSRDSEAREDPRGGPNYNRYDRVRIESTWKDRLHKESESSKDARDKHGPPLFQVNLANTCNNSGAYYVKHSHNRLEVVCEKDLKQSPESRMSLGGFHPKSFEVALIEHTKKGPVDKSDLPLTSSQYIGWLLANPVRADRLLGIRHTERSASAPQLKKGGSRAATAPPALAEARPAVMPANDRIMKRNRSAPALHRGPPLPELLELNRFRRPQHSCDESKYAEAYQVKMHHSPFNKEAAGR